MLNSFFSGNHSYIVDGKLGLGHTGEAERIHKENLSKLAEMTHEERLRERNELMSRLTPEQQSFLQSLRKRKEAVKRNVKINDANYIERMETDLEIKNADSPELMNQIVSELSSSNDLSLATHPKETTPVSTSLEVQTVPLEELPIPPDKAKKWVHMDKVSLGFLIQNLEFIMNCSIFLYLHYIP